VKDGDISNESPRRIVVSIDAMVVRHPVIHRTLGIPYADEEYEWDRLMLNRLWQFTNRTPLMVEMAVFGMSPEVCMYVSHSLEETGTNPVNFVNNYTDRQQLVDSLAFRPDVLGVIDLPEFQMMYGLRGMGSEHM